MHTRTARRARLLPVMTAARLAPLAPQMADVAVGHVARWPLGRPFALLPRVRELALDVFVRTVLPVRDPRRAQALRKAVLRMLWSPLIAPGVWMPDPVSGPLGRAGWSVFRALRRPVDECCARSSNAPPLPPTLSEGAC